MKTPQFILCGLGAAMLCLNPNATTLRAQSFETKQFLSTERLNIKLTAMMQGDTVDVVNNGNPIGTRDNAPTRVRVDNKALLQLYGAPVGSKLVLLDGSTVAYQTGTSDPVDTGITFSLDDPFVAITKGQQTEVSSDTKDVSKTVYTAQYVGNPILESFSVPENDFDIIGFSFSLVGMAKETVNNKSTDTDSSSNSSSNHSFTFSGVGNGTINLTTNSPSVVISGSITTAGKDHSSAE